MTCTTCETLNEGSPARVRGLKCNARESSQAKTQSQNLKEVVLFNNIKKRRSVCGNIKKRE